MIRLAGGALSIVEDLDLFEQRAMMLVLTEKIAPPPRQNQTFGDQPREGCGLSKSARKIGPSIQHIIKGLTRASRAIAITTGTRYRLETPSEAWPGSRNTPDQAFGSSLSVLSVACHSPVHRPAIRGGLVHELRRAGSPSLIAMSLRKRAMFSGLTRTIHVAASDPRDERGAGGHCVT